MAESMCIPVPSEIIFGLGGAMCTTAVATGTPLNLALVIIIGLAGELVGATIAYQLGRTLGREFVDKWGKRFLLTHKDLDRAEAFFAKYGIASLLIGRMIPVVRSVISVPAGVAEMGRVRFTALTAAGSAVWISVLASIGYGLGSNWQHAKKYFDVATWPIVGLLVAGLAFGFWHRWRAVRSHQT